MARGLVIGVGVLSKSFRKSRFVWLISFLVSATGMLLTLGLAAGTVGTAETGAEGLGVLCETWPDISIGMKAVVVAAVRDT